MAKQISQAMFNYYDPITEQIIGSPEDTPGQKVRIIPSQTSSSASLSNKIIQIGIQAEPGTRFLINGSDDIYIGRSGIYEAKDCNISSVEVYNYYSVTPSKAETTSQLIDDLKDLDSWYIALINSLGTYDYDNKALAFDIYVNGRQSSFSYPSVITNSFNLFNDDNKNKEDILDAGRYNLMSRTVKDEELITNYYYPKNIIIDYITDDGEVKNNG